jgi:hypothetical protein
MKVKTFFETVCPVLLQIREALCRAAGGRYAFDLAGHQGGCWTLDFTALTVSPRLEPADLTLRMSAQDFAAVLQGKLDVRSAVATGHVSFTGDQFLFGNLAALTAPLPERVGASQITNGRAS